MGQKFVADVGGTNIRLARVTESGVADIKNTCVMTLPVSIWQ